MDIENLEIIRNHEIDLLDFYQEAPPRLGPAPTPPFVSAGFIFAWA
jgi:hypothetical protein